MKKKKVTKKSKDKKTEYAKRAGYIGDKILEISRSTKRKCAYVKVAIPDEFAEKLIKNSFTSLVEEREITALYLHWVEKVNEENNRG